uniref:Uncharacterized protein n=1 Tax=Zea mays TaxID=4577 RepID=A0A804P290_MAIZE
MDVSVGSRARHLTDVDGDLWDLVRRDLQLKATFLYIDLNSLIACNECEERREEITLLANDFFYCKDEEIIHITLLSSTAVGAKPCPAAVAALEEERAHTNMSATGPRRDWSRGPCATERSSRSGPVDRTLGTGSGRRWQAQRPAAASSLETWLPRMKDASGSAVGEEVEGGCEPVQRHMYGPPRWQGAPLSEASAEGAPNERLM